MPRTIPSRAGPGKPGQSATVTGDAKAVVGLGFGLGEAASFAVWESSRSSGVGVHRQCRSESPSPDIPPVRTSVNPALASTIATTIELRRTPVPRRRVPTAQATKATHKTGIARMGNNIPIAPPAIDL